MSVDAETHRSMLSLDSDGEEGGYLGWALGTAAAQATQPAAAQVRARGAALADAPACGAGRARAGLCTAWPAGGCWRRRSPPPPCRPPL